MRISDWSSDVCSSDLPRTDDRDLLPGLRAPGDVGDQRFGPFGMDLALGADEQRRADLDDQPRAGAGGEAVGFLLQARLPSLRTTGASKRRPFDPLLPTSERRMRGKGVVWTFRSRWSLYHK